MDTRVKAALIRLTENDLPGDYRCAIARELRDLTGSEISYVMIVNMPESTLTPVTWLCPSEEVYCAATGYSPICRIENAGHWGEAIRQRRAVITNEPFTFEKTPPNDCSDSRIQVRNHLSLPIFAEDKIVLVAGVGNKAGEYTAEDVALLTELMSEVWEIFEMPLWVY